MTIHIFSVPGVKNVPYKSFSFSAGEKQVRVGPIDPDVKEILVKSYIESSEDAMELFMVLNALGNMDLDYPNLTLTLPYLPYSRQDRVCYPGEAFGLDAFLQLLVQSLPKNVKKPQLITWDVHSNVAARLCECEWLEFVNLTSETDFLVRHFLEELRQIENEMIVVAPDKGAVERAKAVWNYFGSSDNGGKKLISNNRTLFGEKVRDPDTGEILGTLVFAQDDDGNASHLIPGRPNSSHIKGKPILIVDDICDGGRTFIELAKVLRQYEPSQITLYVTHGIFSKGFNVFKDESGKPLIDNFLITNPFQKCLDWAEYEEVKISKTSDNKLGAISVRL